MTRQPPELCQVSIEHGVALDPDLLDDFLVEIIQQLLARVALRGLDVRLELPLQLIELELDLLRCSTFLVDRGDPLFKVHPGLDSAEHLATFLARAEAEDGVVCHASCAAS